jgi:tetratricopeptide (TPR) repeat protein
VIIRFVEQTFEHIALVYVHLKSYQQALDYYKRALEMRETIFGEAHPHVLDTQNKMAEIVQLLNEDPNEEEDDK